MSKWTLLIVFLCITCSGILFTADAPVITPDQPEYVQILTDELLEIVFIEKPHEKVLAFEKIAGKRITELEIILARRKWVYGKDLLNAYSDVLRNGILPHLHKAGTTGKDITPTAERLHRKIRKHFDLLTQYQKAHEKDLGKVLNRTIDDCLKTSLGIHVLRLSRSHSLEDIRTIADYGHKAYSRNMPYEDILEITEQLIQKNMQQAHICSVLDYCSRLTAKSLEIWNKEGKPTLLETLGEVAVIDTEAKDSTIQSQSTAALLKRSLQKTAGLADAHAKIRKIKTIKGKAEKSNNGKALGKDKNKK